METRFSRALQYTGLLFQDRNNSEQSDEWDFPCIGHNTYVCSRKKVGARRHERLLLKKSLFVPATVVGLFRSSSWKSNYPNSMAKVSVILGCGNAPASSVPDVNYPGHLPWENWHLLDGPAHLLADNTAHLPCYLPFPWTGLSNGYTTGFIKSRILDWDLIHWPLRR